MGPMFHLYIKDLKLFFNDRLGVLLSFLVPAAMAIVFGFTFGSMGSGGVGDLEIYIDVVDNDQSELSASIIEAVENTDVLIPSIVTEEEAYKHVRGTSRPAALIIPEGFGEKVKNSEKVDLKLIYDPSDPLENGVIEGVMNQVLVTSDIAEYIYPAMIKKMLVDEGEDDIAINIAMTYVDKYFIKPMKEELSKSSSDNGDSSFLSSAFENFPVGIEKEQVAGNDISTTAGHVQAIVSAMIMFLLFSVSAGASALLKEKKGGTLKRLLVAPINVEGILTAKLFSMMTTGMMQVYFMFIVGWLLFHLEIWAHPVQLFLMAIATTLMASGLGIMLTGFAKSEEQAQMLSTLVILTVAAAGGAMVPRYIMPNFMKTIGNISPVAWAVDGFHNIFWYRQGFAGMLPQFGVLIGFALVFLVTGSIFVRRQLKSG